LSADEDVYLACAESGERLPKRLPALKNVRVQPFDHRLREKLLNHLLDPLWRHFPFPAGHTFEATVFEDATVLRMTRTYRGRELLPVYCYAIGATLVDTGLSSVADEVVAAARRAKVERVVLTHHRGHAALE
jgi:hypothetical protein